MEVYNLFGEEEAHLKSFFPSEAYYSEITTNDFLMFSDAQGLIKVVDSDFKEVLSYEGGLKIHKNGSFPNRDFCVQTSPLFALNIINGSLGLISKLNFEIFMEIDTFWFTDDQKASNPLGLVYTPQGQKVLGISVNDSNEHYIHYYELIGDVNNPKIDVEQTSQILEKIRVAEKYPFDTIEGVKLSEDRTIVYYVGSVDEKKSRNYIACCKFDQNLVLKNFKKLDLAGQISRLKRIPGYEILVLAAGSTLMFVKYNEVEAKFEDLATLIDLHSSPITDYCFYRDKLYSKSLGNPLKIIIFDKGLKPVLSPPVLKKPELGSGGHPFEVKKLDRIQSDAFHCLQKISFSNDFEYLFVGGNGLHILKRAPNSTFDPVHIDPTASKRSLFNFDFFSKKI